MDRNKIQLTDSKKRKRMPSITKPLANGIGLNQIRIGKEPADLRLTTVLMANYLHLMIEAGLVINSLLKILSILTNKRITLAEKAIQAEFRACSKWERQLISVLLKCRRDQLYVFDQSDCKKLRQINIKLAQELKAFLKVANYDLNYTEQYYEHDFWLRISADKFSSRLEGILNHSAAESA